MVKRGMAREAPLLIICPMVVVLFVGPGVCRHVPTVHVYVCSQQAQVTNVTR